MSDSEEIEVEVVEVVDEKPALRPNERPVSSPTKGPQGAGQGAFTGHFSVNSRRVPFYLWPLVIIAGICFIVLFVAIALLLVVFVVIPFLIIRAILRLLLPAR